MRTDKSGAIAAYYNAPIFPWSMWDRETILTIASLRIFRSCQAVLPLQLGRRQRMRTISWTKRCEFTLNRAFLKAGDRFCGSEEAPSMEIL